MNRFVRAALVLLLAALAVAAFYAAGPHTPPRCDHALFSQAAHNCVP